MNIVTREATNDDAIYIANTLREHDLKELSYTTKKTPQEALTASLLVSNECYTVTVDGVPALIYGFGYLNGKSGDAVIWMLSNDLIESIPTWFLRESKEVINRFAEKTTRLFNFVWEGNKTSVKWLVWLGFQLFTAQPYGLAQKNFHYFEMNNV